MKLLSTMGWSADVVLHPLNVLKPEQAVIFYGTNDEDSRQKVEAAMDKIKNNAKMALKFVEVNPFSLEDCIEKMRPELTEDSIANITGGTKLMSFALALLATYGYYTDGAIPVIYVVTKGGNTELKRIPLVVDEMDLGFKKNKKNTIMRQILQILHDNGDELSGAEIRAIMKDNFGRNVSSPGFSEAKAKLACRNLISERKKGNAGYYSLKSGAWFFLESDENGNA